MFTLNKLNRYILGQMKTPYTNFLYKSINGLICGQYIVEKNEYGNIYMYAFICNNFFCLVDGGYIMLYKLYTIKCREYTVNLADCFDILNLNSIKRIFNLYFYVEQDNKQYSSCLEFRAPDFIRKGIKYKSLNPIGHLYSESFTEVWCYYDRNWELEYITIRVSNNIDRIYYDIKYTKEKIIIKKTDYKHIITDTYIKF